MLLRLGVVTVDFQKVRQKKVQHLIKRLRCRAKEEIKAKGREGGWGEARRGEQRLVLVIGVADEASIDTGVRHRLRDRGRLRSCVGD